MEVRVCCTNNQFIDGNNYNGEIFKLLKNLWIESADPDIVRLVKLNEISTRLLDIIKPIVYDVIGNFSDSKSFILQNYVSNILNNIEYGKVKYTNETVLSYLLFNEVYKLALEATKITGKDYGEYLHKKRDSLNTISKIYFLDGSTL